MAAEVLQSMTANCSRTGGVSAIAARGKPKYSQLLQVLHENAVHRNK
jgi:hypothetical protein